MSDDRKLTRGKVAIVDKHGTPMRPGKHDENGIINAPSDEFMQQPVTREEMLEALPKAALAVGQKMFDQITSETAEQLERMEHIITQRVTRNVIKELSRRFNLREEEAPPEPPALVVDQVLDEQAHPQYVERPATGATEQ